MHLAIPTLARFLFKKLFMKTVVFLIQKFLRHAAHTFVAYVRYPCMCALRNGFQQPVHSAPLVFPVKKAQVVKPQLHSKQSSNDLFPENFMTIGGCFGCYTYCVTALGWLKKEEKEGDDKQFRLSTVSGLPL